jgi:hypothetical protein
MVLSTPVLIGLLVLVTVVGAAAGLWQARKSGATGVQSALGVLLVAVIAAVLTWVVLRRR